MPDWYGYILAHPWKNCQELFSLKAKAYPCLSLQSLLYCDVPMKGDCNDHQAKEEATSPQGKQGDSSEVLREPTMWCKATQGESTGGIQVLR